MNSDVSGDRDDRTLSLVGFEYERKSKFSSRFLVWLDRGATYQYGRRCLPFQQGGSWAPKKR